MCHFGQANPAVVTTQGVDFVVDGGQRMANPSTVVDMTGATPLLLRQGRVRRPNDS